MKGPIAAERSWDLDGAKSRVREFMETWSAGYVALASNGTEDFPVIKGLLAPGQNSGMASGVSF